MSGVNKVIIVGLYLDGKSIPQISSQTGMTRSTVRNHLHKAGVLRSRVDAVRLAARQGRLGTGMRGKKRVFTDEHKNNISLSKTGVGSGKSKKQNGYIEITMGENKWRGEHRVIIEQHLGRTLEANEVVHHIDGNRSNNCIENLLVMTRSKHASHHARETYKTRKRDALGRFI